jgi:arylsulfatase
MAGVKPGRIGELAGRDLPGKDLTPLLTNPGGADLHAVREGVLFTYSGLVTVDSQPLGLVSKARAEGKDWQALLKAGLQPDLKKRGAARAVFDGRYKFTRYFSPEDRNRPRTIDELYQYNDVELFDLQTDPSEMVNLAATKGENRDLVLALSAKLEALIKMEMGVDDGREMPPFKGVVWTIDTADNETVLD